MKEITEKNKNKIKKGIRLVQEKLASNSEGEVTFLIGKNENLKIVEKTWHK